MELLEKRLPLFRKRSLEWTGDLERVFREFANAARAELSDDELDHLLALPDQLLTLGQAGVLTAIELQAGRDGIRITLDADPNGTEDLNLSMLPLCDLTADKIDLRLFVTDEKLARTLGAGEFPKWSSPHLHITLRGAGNPATGSPRPVNGNRLAVIRRCL